MKSVIPAQAGIQQNKTAGGCPAKLNLILPLTPTLSPKERGMMVTSTF
jgi:hypothetical protein